MVVTVVIAKRLFVDLVLYNIPIYVWLLWLRVYLYIQKKKKMKYINAQNQIKILSLIHVTIRDLLAAVPIKLGNSH